MGQYERHVFVCTTGKTCAAQGSSATYHALKDAARAAGLKGRARVNQSGCLNQCGHGPMVVVYPEDTWYAAVDADGARRIVDEHLVDGAPVDALRYVAPRGDNKLPKDELARIEAAGAAAQADGAARRSGDAAP
jgi:(2Fe-2S) ferredoxin